MKNKGLVLRTLIVLILWTVVSIGCEQPTNEDEWIFVNMSSFTVHISVDGFGDFALKPTDKNVINKPDTTPFNVYADGGGVVSFTLRGYTTFYDASGKIKIINGSSDHNIVEIGVTTNIKKNKNDYEVFETGLTVINGEEKEYTLLSTGYWVYIKDDEDHYYYTTQITLQYGSTKIITYNGKGITVR